jgi:CubicO group peptidase (beta-lactamase class C family)
MVYCVGSVSRQFTAAAIALLAHEGHVALGDNMRRYIPELRTYGPMTIRHLAGRVRHIRFVRQQEARQ